MKIGISEGLPGSYCFGSYYKYFMGYIIYDIVCYPIFSFSFRLSDVKYSLN